MMYNRMEAKPIAGEHGRFCGDASAPLVKTPCCQQWICCDTAFGSCWIPGSWMCWGRPTRFLVALSSLKPFFFNGLKNESRFSDHMGAQDPGIQ
jgi:hypothetical protein